MSARRRPSRTGCGRPQDPAVTARRRLEGATRPPGAGREVRLDVVGRYEKGYALVTSRNDELHLDPCPRRQHPVRADGQPIQRAGCSWAEATYATKPLCNLVRVRMGRLVDWNNRTLAPIRTTIRLARRGLDCSCTASCSITSMASPTAVGSLISTTVTAGRGWGGGPDR